MSSLSEERFVSKRKDSSNHDENVEKKPKMETLGYVFDEERFEKERLRLLEEAEMAIMAAFDKIASLEKFLSENDRQNVVMRSAKIEEENAPNPDTTTEEPLLTPNKKFKSEDNLITPSRTPTIYPKKLSDLLALPPPESSQFPSVESPQIPPSETHHAPSLMDLNCSPRFNESLANQSMDYFDRSQDPDSTAMPSAYPKQKNDSYLRANDNDQQMSYHDSNQFYKNKAKELGNRDLLINLKPEEPPLYITYINNLGNSANPEDLMKVFEHAGLKNFGIIIKHRPTHSFGFLNFTDEENYKKALELNHQISFNGLKIGIRSNSKDPKINIRPPEKSYDRNHHPPKSSRGSSNSSSSRNKKSSSSRSYNNSHVDPWRESDRGNASSRYKSSKSSRYQSRGNRKR